MYAACLFKNHIMEGATLRLLLLLLSLVTQTLAQENALLSPSCSDAGNYTADSIYRRNVETVLSRISSNTDIDYGFYNFSAGQNPNVVNSIALCRGDVTLTLCRSCLNESRQELLRRCPNQKEAIIYYDNCLVRFSNRSIFRTVESNLQLLLQSPNNATDVESYIEARGGLLNRLRSQAASGDSRRKFAVGSTTASNSEPVHGLVQCTPDLSQLDCDRCLAQMIGGVQRFNGRSGGRILTPSCNFRYENYRFYEETEQAPPPSERAPSPPSGGKESNTSRTVIAIVVPIAVVAILIVIVCIVLKKRKPRKTTETVGDIEGPESLQYDFSTVRAATNNFYDGNKLGQGGFGSVYIGHLSNGQKVAVKRLSKNSGQGDLEFENEVMLVAKLQHRNLVRLLGFCLQGDERILIYEFVPNASLDHFIFDPNKRAQLDWETRLKIIGGIARGLLYLHEDSRLRIIHRDLKASNILIDEEMIPKIADFGMAKLFSLDQTHADTSRIVGTYGYMAPEYAMHGNFSIKSDVYSFGVLVLEIVSGQRNGSFQNGQSVGDLISHAWRHWREGTISNLIDSTMRTGSRNEMMRCIHIGLLCVQENVTSRPTMSSVVLMLNTNSITLPVPSPPAFYMFSSSQSEASSSQIDSSTEAIKSNTPQNNSVNEASITDIYPR